MRPAGASTKGGEKRDSKRAARRSRENLEADSHAALAPPGVPRIDADAPTAESAVELPLVNVRQASVDPTVASNVEDAQGKATATAGLSTTVLEAADRMEAQTSQMQERVTRFVLAIQGGGTRMDGTASPPGPVSLSSAA